MTFTMFWFLKPTKSLHSADPDGFGVYFEMGKKGYRKDVGSINSISMVETRVLSCTKILA